MKQVGIVGSGNVGTSTAFFLAENGTASAVLVDARRGMTTGKALDLMEAGPLRGYHTRIRGADSIEAISGSHVVVIAAGRVRQPGEHRVDLYQDNAPTVVNICEEIKEVARDAVVINVVEPVDLLTGLAQSVLGFERTRVLGVGGLLTATRLRYLVSRELGVSPRETTALVLGPHHESMVFLKDSIRVSGLPVSHLIEDTRLNALIEQARTAGDTILGLAQRSTAYYGPSAAAATLVEAVCRNTHAILPVSMVCEGEYGVHQLSVGVPAQVGEQGVEKVLHVRMSEQEQAAFQRAVARLQDVWQQVQGSR